MGYLDRVFPLGRADWLRKQLLAAITEAYDENCRRYTEDIGDNATTFGILTFHNLCFFIEQRLQDVPGVRITRPDNAFVVEIDGYFLHIYKAPPGVTTIEGVRFDRSRVRLNLVKHNADQLKLDFDTPFEGPVPQHLVVVHFGDPIDGLNRTEIGAPITTDLQGSAWLWSEPLVLDPMLQDEPVESEADEWLAPSLPDFGLKLVEPAERDLADDANAS